MVKLIEPGVYRARVIIGAAPNQTRALKTFRRKGNETTTMTKDRAERWVLDKKNQLRSTPVESRNRTIELLVSEFLASRDHRTSGTIENYHRHCKIFIRFAASEGASFVFQIDEALCVKFYRHLLKKYPSRSGPKHKWNTLKMLLTHEYRRTDSVFLKNPSAAVVTNFQTIDDDEVMDFTEDEQVAFFGALQSEHARMVFRFLLMTGMRRGEAANFPTRHLSVDVQTGFLVANVRTHTTNGYTWKPKTKTSRRSIPIMREAMSIVQYFIDLNGNKPFLLGGDRPVHQGFFRRNFTSARRRIINTRPDLRDRFEALRDGTQQHWLTTHSFRKTFGTRMLNRGMSRENVRDLLGHSDLAMSRIYAHLLMPAHIDTINRFSNIFGAVQTAPSQLFVKQGDRRSDTSRTQMPIAA